MSVFIFNSEKPTKEELFVATRRTVTCMNVKAYVKQLGNGYVEQEWTGDITDHPAYIEFDEVFQK